MAIFFATLAIFTGSVLLVEPAHTPRELEDELLFMSWPSLSLNQSRLRL